MRKNLIKLFILTSMFSVCGAHAVSINNVLSSSEELAEQGVSAQKKVDGLDGDIRSLANEYRSIVSEIEGLNIYLLQLKKQMSFQTRELNRLDDSLNSIKDMERNITPLMLNMIDGLEAFIKLDMPFQQQQRLEKVEELKQLMTKSTATVAERYRRILNAYQDEIEYARTLEVFGGAKDGVDVDFLRVGRVALMYRSKDGQTMGMWNQKKVAWEPVDSSNRTKIDKAMRIAAEQAAPDLIRIPLVAPEFINNASN